MPLTNETEEAAGKGAYHHVWLNAEPSTLAEVDGAVTSGHDRVPALCGEVHVNHVGELIRVSEVERVDHEDMESFLAAEHTCTECADVAREALGLEARRLEDVSGIGRNKADRLRAAGFHDVGDLRASSQQELSEVEGIGNAFAARIKADVGNIEVQHTL